MDEILEQVVPSQGIKNTKLACFLLDRSEPVPIGWIVSLQMTSRCIFLEGSSRSLEDTITDPGGTLDLLVLLQICLACDTFVGSNVTSLYISMMAN